jgi:hypothetical protein
METRDEKSDVSESVTVSLVIAAVATAMIYLELWGGSVPAIGGSMLALGAVGGLVVGALFYVLGTRSSSDQTVPVFGVLLTVAVVAFLLFPDGLPTAAEFGIVVAVWTDTAIRAVAKFG